MTITIRRKVLCSSSDILQYDAKNLFFFRCKLRQCYGAHRGREGIAEIAPDGFDVHTRMVQNLLFRIAEYGGVSDI